MSYEEAENIFRILTDDDILRIHKKYLENFHNPKNFYFKSFQINNYTSLCKRLEIKPQLELIKIKK